MMSEQSSTMALERAVSRRARAHVGRRGRERYPHADVTVPAEEALPDYVLDAAHRALDEGETHYTDVRGFPETRSAIAGYLVRNGYPVDPEYVAITNGGREAVFVALHAMLDANSSATVAGPYFPHLADILDLIGARQEWLFGSRETAFLPEPEAIRASSSDLLFLSNPSPVCGLKAPEGWLKTAVNGALEDGRTVILDVSGAGMQPRSDIGEIPELRDLIDMLLVGSFSDSHALSGWRAGFMHVPRRLQERIFGLKTAMSISTAPVVQRAAQAALSGGILEQDDRWSRFNKRLKWLMAELDELGYDDLVVDSYPGLLISAVQEGGGDALAAQLLDAGVKVFPGSRFGQATGEYIWVTMAAEDDALRSFLEALAALNGDLRDGWE